FDALALVGLRPPERPDLRRHLPDALLVHAEHADRGRTLRLDLDVLRDRIVHVVAVAELQPQHLAFDRSAVADAVDLEVLGEALAHPLDQTVGEAPVGAPHRPRAFGVASRPDPELVPLDRRLDLLGERQPAFAELTLGDDGPTIEPDLGARRDGDRIFAYARHFTNSRWPDQNTWQSTSPPTLSCRASWSETTPRG